ncbi:hypothetical protein FGLOB1_14050 [Fusarium globosum]|uniref:Uncharacterized protein n=1 Tax=Fusarium globosum TaxID=78864 RepID=A0A8H5XKW1_9HYPO|nr:hypothetical protein FGLOB1_14050 [Fusarium globosum]
MSDHDLSFLDLESAAIKEMYPEADDTRLLKRLQANWLKYHQYWDPKTKQDLLDLINRGDVRTNDTNRFNASGHKLWKKHVKLTWAVWIVMRTHYGIQKLKRLQFRLIEEFPRIVPSSWVCPDQQNQGYCMAGGDSDDGPLCVENQETVQEADHVQTQTHTDSGSTKRAYSVTPTGSRAKRRQFNLAINKPLDQSLPIGPNPGTPSQPPSLAERMIEATRNSPGVTKDELSFFTHKLRESRSQNNGTHIGTPVPMSNSPLSEPIPTNHRGRQQRKEQGVSGAPQDVSTTSLELIQAAGRAAKAQEAVAKAQEAVAKVQEAAANIERSVGKLEVSVPEQMADMKRSLENLKSITDAHCEELMDSQRKFEKSQDIVKQQIAQIASQNERIDKMEDYIASQKERMDKIEDCIASQKERMDKMEDDTASHKERMDKMEDDTASHKERMDSTEDTILRVWGKEFLSQGSASQYSQGAATPMSAPPSNQTMRDAKRQHSITNEGRTPVDAGPGIPQPNILPEKAHISQHHLLPTENSLQQGVTDVAEQSRPPDPDFYKFIDFDRGQEMS